MSQVFSIPTNAYDYSVSNINRQDPTEPALDFHASFVNGTAVTSLGADAYSVTLKAISLHNLIPNINKYNNTLQMQFDNNAPRTMVFPPNNYTIASMMTLMNSFLAAMDTSGMTPGLSLSQDPNSKLLSIFVPDGHIFQFLRPTPPGNPAQAVQNSFNFRTSTYDRALDWLGFMPLIQAGQGVFSAVNSGSSGKYFFATNPCNLFGTTYIDICIPVNVGCVHMTPLAKSIIARVPITTQFGQVQYYEPTVQHSFPLTATDLDNLHITVFDAWGWPVDTVPQNTQFMLKLLLVPLNQD